MKSIILAIAVAAIFTSLGFADVYLEENFDSGTMSDKWQVLLEGEAYVDEEGCLVIGSKDGEGNTLDSCVGLGEDDWSSYIVSGSFRFEKSSDHSPFLINFHKIGSKNVFVIISDEDPIKLVEIVADLDFIKPVKVKSADVGATLLFGLLGAAATAGDIEAYDSEIETQEGFWRVLDETDFECDEKEWYDFRLVVDGTSAEFYINNIPIVRSALLNKTNGTLAFSAVDDVRVYLDNIVVEVPSKPTEEISPTPIGEVTPESTEEVPPTPTAE